MNFDLFLLLSSTLLLVGVLMSKASGRFGVPALLLFLGIGLLAGVDGPGGISFNNPAAAQSLGIVALAFILFSGGVATEWESVRPVLWSGLSLATIGVTLTAIVVGAAATIFGPFSWLEGLLLGAIVSSTDAAAVFSVLRSRGASLKGRLRPLLEFESGSNDPMAVLLTVALTQMIVTGKSETTWFVSFFVQQMTLGALGGVLLGRALVLVINRIDLEYEGLYPVLTLGSVLAIYSGVASIGGNGFLAVYVAGLVVGNRTFLHKQSLVRFHDGLAWLMQIAMFMTLGLLATPSELVPNALMGTVLTLVLMFIARPFSVLLTLIPSNMSFRQKLLISWVGLRGSVPIILATFPLLAGVSHAEPIFHVVFFIVIFSVAVQGTTIPVVAKWLGLAKPSAKHRAQSMEFYPSGTTNTRLIEIVVNPSSHASGKAVIDLHIPDGLLLVLLQRGNDYAVPRGSTVIEAGDVVTIAGDSVRLAEVRRLFEEVPVA